MKLPLKCEAEYFQDFLTKTESEQLYNHLITDFNLADANSFRLQNGDLIKLNFGKTIFMDEDIFNKNLLPSSIWGNTAVWSEKMRALKRKVELHTSRKFEVCVCIFYPDGNSGVDFHSDYLAYGDTSYIPSISLGEEREFVLREKDNFQRYEINLANGSLIIMGEECQELYEHSLPTNPKYKNGRVNLTFRKFGNN
jgi:hypothetical protein